MSLTQCAAIQPTYTAFVYAGTQASIDALNAYLGADSGWCEAQYVDATTWALKNPGFDNNFYNRDISEKWLFMKNPTMGALSYGPFAGIDNVYWAAT